jgi:hypothetical protein
LAPLLLRKSKHLSGAHEGKTERGHLMEVSNLSIKKKSSVQKKKKLARKKKPLLKETGGTAGACMRVQLGLVVWA